MGRATTIARYEITPQIKELQKLAHQLHSVGYEVNVDITQDLVTVNNIHKYTRDEAKPELQRLLAGSKASKGSTEFPDLEKEAKEAKAKAKRDKKHREPGAPPELKTIIRRAKRIFKKAFIKLGSAATAEEKAKIYLQKKTEEANHAEALTHLNKYIQKELSKV